jgi:hypothetical protein
MASQAVATDHFGGEDFASLLDETLGLNAGFEGSVVTGKVIRLPRNSPSSMSASNPKVAWH